MAEGLPFYQGNADFGAIHPTPRVWCNVPVKIAEAGHLLVFVRAPIGALNFANENAASAVADALKATSSNVKQY